MPLAKLVPSNAVPGGTILRRLVRQFDEAGIAAALMSEHPAPSFEWLRNDPAAHDCLDPLIALAMIAASSDRLKVFTNVLVLPYRNPFLTAKVAATLQILSDNRLILGVGTGYQREEFEALGVPHGKRGKLTDEALETISLAWKGGPVVKRGRHFEAKGNEPRPLPSPLPPIWVGGGSDWALLRAATWGDSWVPYFTVPTDNPVVRQSAVVSMAHFAEKAARLKELRAGLGRERPFTMSVAPPFRPQELTRGDALRFLGEAAELATHGVEWIWTSLPAPSLEAYVKTVAWYAEEIIAEYAKAEATA